MIIADLAQKEIINRLPINQPNIQPTKCPRLRLIPVPRVRPLTYRIRTNQRKHAYKSHILTKKTKKQNVGAGLPLWLPKAPLSATVTRAIPPQDTEKNMATSR